MSALLRGVEMYLRLPTSGQGMSAKTLARASGMHKRSAERLLAALLRTGAVRRLQRREPKRSALWWRTGAP